MRPFSVDIVQLREFEIVFTQPELIAVIECEHCTATLSLADTYDLN